jgi:anti-sigma B factor antagonist
MPKDAPTGSANGGRHDLRVPAEVDLNTVTEIEQRATHALTDPAVRLLTIDLSNVTFIDSTGIGTLIRVRLNAEEHHKQLVLARPSPTVLRLLAITALTAAFTIDDTTADTQPTQA